MASPSETQLTVPDFPSPTSETGNAYHPHLGFLNPSVPSEEEVAQALEDVRESEEGYASTESYFIVDATYYAVWYKIFQEPKHYVMTRVEFAVFNYWQHIHKSIDHLVPLARAATSRYWENTYGDE